MPNRTTSRARPVPTTRPANQQARSSVRNEDADAGVREHHDLLKVVIGQLDGRGKRLLSGLEALRIGRGGSVDISRITGLSYTTVWHGCKEVLALQSGKPLKKVIGRRGHPPTESKYPNIRSDLEKLLAHEVAGDPMSQKKWIRASSRQLRRQLSHLGYRINHCTVCRLLKDMGYSLRINKKTRAVRQHCPRHDAQFQHIAAKKAAFLRAGWPVISVDAKKTELIGNFKMEGRSWRKAPIRVHDFKFPSLAKCAATPFGVYDVATNKGYVWVNTSANTPEFAVSTIREWWLYAGRHVYPDAHRVLVLADCGGSNGCRCRVWKEQLQSEICDALGLTITVCHYPPGWSKYNPIERLLFSQISINWAGQPLTSLELMLGYIRGTRTETGLSVEAFLVDRDFEKGRGVADAIMRRLALRFDPKLPEWNYTIKPR